MSKFADLKIPEMTQMLEDATFRPYDEPEVSEMSDYKRLAWRTRETHDLMHPVDSFEKCEDEECKLARAVLALAELENSTDAEGWRKLKEDKAALEEENQRLREVLIKVLKEHDDIKEGDNEPECSCPRCLEISEVLLR